MASSSSFSVPKKHTIFLSFRGQDTRNTFTSHLHAALERKGMNTFIDYQLERGEEISPALLTAIEESKLSIIVLSKSYASSSWCLDELSKILECKKTNGQKIVPIFYHVDPSVVRYQKGSFEEAFAKHQERFKDQTVKVEKWKADLKEIADLSGFHLSGQPTDKPESNLIVEIVEDISKKLMYKFSINDTKCLIGIDSRIKQIESKLCFGLADVRIVGIWGLGGIGKTTIAEAVYGRFFDEFEICYFLENVKGKYGQVRLREDLFSKILEDRNLNVGTSLLPLYIKDRFQHKKVLIVFDDVDDSMQLHLSVEKQYFGPGSRIILTGRDKQVLQPVVDDDEIYKVEELNHNEALELFSLCAFKQSHPKAYFLELSKKVVHYAQGLPLALRVLGSALYAKSKLFWEGELDKLKEIPNLHIDNILRISFDGLDHEVRDIFLDIACFFKGHDRDYVKDIMDGCYRSVMSGISVLIDKSLVTIQHKRLEMHDLLQQMAWNIICQESKEPGQRSRLWIPKDIYHVLKNNTGTESIEGMFLDISETSQELWIRPTAFVKMHNLKFLKFYSSGFQKRKVYLSEQGLESLPDNLRLLHWDCYPLKSLPSNFYPENLVELSMPKSNLERLWNGHQNLVKLKRVDLSGSQHLTKIRKLSQATKLESMKLDGCTSLVKIPSSIRYLNNLSFLSLKKCQNLGNFPSSVYLRSLKTLVLIGCSNVTKFPEISGSLKFLYLNETAIEEVPSSIGSLCRLTYLYLINCKRLERLPSSICELKFLEKLRLFGCSKLKSFPEILETMERLKYLDLEATSIKELPSSIENLVGLITLGLDNCKKIKNLPSSIRKLKFLTELNLRNCSHITQFPEIPGNLRWLNMNETAIEQLPSSIDRLCELQVLYLDNCTKLGSLPSNILKLKSLQLLSVEGFSKLEVVQELLGTVQEVYIDPLNGTANISLEWSIENQRGHLSSNLSSDELVNLRYSIGNMRSLQKLHVSDYPVFDGLLDNLENLESLKYLRVSFCNLFEIPSYLTCISSLRDLDLSRNKFETIPSSIKQLFNLEKLDLSYCERLQSLPELPPNLQYLDAHCCSSLEAVSSLFTIGLGRWVTYLFDNCLKLDQNTISHILAESQLRIQHRATEALKLYHEVSVQSSSLLICLPGCEIPEWFSCQSTGSSVTTQLPLCGDDRKFVGFALCAILEFEDDDEGFAFSLECKYNYKTNNGDHHVGFCSLFSGNRWLGSDHMFLAYDFCLGYDLYNEVSIYHSNEASFEFYVLDLDSSPQGCCKVEKCGIHLLYGQNTICPVSLPCNAIVIQPSESGSGSGSSDLPYAKDAEECNSIVIYQPSSSSDPTWLSLKCDVNNQDFGEPMVEDGAIMKRCHCYNEAEPSGSFNPVKDAVMILPSSPDDQMWLSLNYGVIDQGFGEPMQEDANDADECTSIVICQPSSSSDPTWLSLKCGVNNQDFGEPMVEDEAIIKRCHCYDEAEPSGSFNRGRDDVMILPRSPDDQTWISLNCGVIDQGFGEPMQEDVTINKRSRDDHHNNEAEPSRNFSSEQLEEEPHPKRPKCTKFF